MFQEVDLTNPKTFRNLAKPMGAQTDERLAQYKKRYKDWEDPNGEESLLPCERCSALAPMGVPAVIDAHLHTCTAKTQQSCSGHLSRCL